MGKKKAKKETAAEQELLDQKKAAKVNAKAEDKTKDIQKEKIAVKKADHNALDGFGETIKRSSVADQQRILNPPVKKGPKINIKRPSVCVCGGAGKDAGYIYVCPGCKHTWCKYCFNGQVNCGKCGTKGV